MTRENLIYFLLYFLLTVFFGLIIPAFFAAVLVLALGTAKEVIYDQANGGVSDLYNMLANLMGAIAGWFLLSII